MEQTVHKIPCLLCSSGLVSSQCHLASELSTIEANLKLKGSNLQHGCCRTQQTGPYTNPQITQPYLLLTLLDLNQNLHLFRVCEAVCNLNCVKSVLTKNVVNSLHKGIVAVLFLIKNKNKQTNPLGFY